MKTRFKPDRGLTSRMVVTSFLLGLLYVAFVAALIAFPLIYPVAALVTVAALAAVPLARSGSLPVSAVNGLGAGGALLAGALVCLLVAL